MLKLPTLPETKKVSNLIKFEFDASKYEPAKNTDDLGVFVKGR